MKHTLYSNYYGWINEEDLKMNIMESELVDDEEEITDEMIWDEMRFLEETYWDDISYELKRFFDKGDAWLLVGTLGLWDGKCKGGYIFNTYDEFLDCLKDCGYWEIVDDKGHLYVKGSHHDGTNHYEIKRVSNFGYEWYNNHGCYIYDEEKVHTKMWNNNFMTSLPHFAKDVYGCKE